ncbi:hypothetical protein MMC09_006835 [Bachmanniomyces sp. S44760]|nr:hypothetical protein [Bachmanniomyces sp. S44760]
MSSNPHTTLSATPTPTPAPSSFAYITSFLLVGMAWGFTTPFIRRAALTYTPPRRPWLEEKEEEERDVTKYGYLRKSSLKGVFTILDLLRNPTYSVPLVMNLTGSIWFFLLVGKAGK